jgi:hypothetical protein
MGIHARIENGYISIHTTAWVEQRTGGVIDELSNDLHGWAYHHPRTDEELAATDLCRWQDAVLAWCRRRGYTSPDPTDPDAGPTVIAHIGSRLDTDLWIARANAPGWGPIAVIQANDDPPVVHADTASDGADWYDADTVDIGCPAGHGWTWRTGRELIDTTGSFTTLSVVFGPDLDAPFTRCPTCTAHLEQRRDKPCDCDHSSWICCPTCGARCDVELPTH